MTIADSGCLMDNGGSCLPHPPEEENRIIAELMKESELNLKEGNLYYVISNRYCLFLLLMKPCMIFDRIICFLILELLSSYIL